MASLHLNIQKLNAPGMLIDSKGVPLVKRKTSSYKFSFTDFPSMKMPFDFLKRHLKAPRACLRCYRNDRLVTVVSYSGYRDYCWYCRYKTNELSCCQCDSAEFDLVDVTLDGSSVSVAICDECPLNTGRLAALSSYFPFPRKRPAIFELPGDQELTLLYSEGPIEQSEIITDACITKFSGTVFIMLDSDKIESCRPVALHKETLWISFKTVSGRAFNLVVTTTEKLASFSHLTGLFIDKTRCLDKGGSWAYTTGLTSPWVAPLLQVIGQLNHDLCVECKFPLSGLAIPSHKFPLFQLDEKELEITGDWTSEERDRLLVFKTHIKKFKDIRKYPRIRNSWSKNLDFWLSTSQMLPGLEEVKSFYDDLHCKFYYMGCQFCQNRMPFV